MNCGCGAVLRFLASIGCRHAALMHLHPNYQWTLADWILHLTEEEQFLFPLLSPEHSANLLAEHRLIRNAIHLGKFEQSKELLEKHSQYEDQLIRELING